MKVGVEWGEAMQQDIAPSDASTRAPGWYLRRGDKEYGPLTDRELAMLAERGGVKTEDRLWKPGFVSWKPIQDIAELAKVSAAKRRAVAAVIASRRGAAGADP